MDCECEFDYPEPDGEPSWHVTRTCDLCGFAWGSLHCEHDGVQNPCPECGWIGPEKRLPSSVIGLRLNIADTEMTREMFDASPDGAAARERLKRWIDSLPNATGHLDGYVD